MMDNRVGGLGFNPRLDFADCKAYSHRTIKIGTDTSLRGKPVTSRHPV